MPIGQTFFAKYVNIFIASEEPQARGELMCPIFGGLRRYFLFFVFRRKRDNRQQILTKIRYFSETIGRTVDVVKFSF